MSAAFIRLPVTAAGRELLRACLYSINRDTWTWVDGAPVDPAHDWDEDAADIEMLLHPPGREAM